MTKLVQTHCPKCGIDNDNSFVWLGGPTYKQRLWGDEELQWWCRKCGYKWSTPCIDANPDIHRNS
jgi:hypothetical protein